MRMKMVCDDRTLAEVANEFLALKKAQKVRERTLNDYKSTSTSFLNKVKPKEWERANGIAQAVNDFIQSSKNLVTESAFTDLFA